MKRLLSLIILCLYTFMSVQAQVSRNKKLAGNGAERKDYNFKIATEKNAEGKVGVVNLCTYVGKKLVNKYAYELNAPIPEDMVDETIFITEDDINFDGYPDVDVNLGYMGGFSNNVQHEALLWNQDSRSFVKAEGYGDIGEPQLDSETKSIFTVLSSGPDERVTTYYRWQGNSLKEYLSNTWKMDDEDVVDFSGMLNYPLYRFDTKLNGRISVILAYQKTDDGIVAGYIYYPKAKHPAPIMIVGTVSQSDGKDCYTLNEYQPDGSISGGIRMECSSDDGEHCMKGVWINPQTKKEMALTDIFFSHEAPKWFSESLLRSETFKMSGPKVIINGIQVEVKK